ncbi:hypothetical protein HDU99_000421 [Rhizoclosmatium hyalinum]|nr:hypothetical protein HDU99_000421 [Rhizoclosmatium hyalinum]
MVDTSYATSTNGSGTQIRGRIAKRTAAVSSSSSRLNLAFLSDLDDRIKELVSARASNATKDIEIEVYKQRVFELEQRLELGSVDLASSCSLCPVERIRSAIQSKQIEKLVAENVELRATINMLRNNTNNSVNELVTTTATNHLKVNHNIMQVHDTTAMRESPKAVTAFPQPSFRPPLPNPTNIHHDPMDSESDTPSRPCIQPVHPLLQPIPHSSQPNSQLSADPIPNMNAPPTSLFPSPNSSSSTRQSNETSLLKSTLSHLPSFTSKEARTLIDELCILVTEKQSGNAELFWRTKDNLAKLGEIARTREERRVLWRVVGDVYLINNIMNPPPSLTLPPEQTTTTTTTTTTSTTPPNNNHRPFDPHSNRGRRKTNSEPASKRIAQNRENQRIHRERKAAYLADLEQKVVQLSSLTSSSTSTPTTPSATDSKLALALARINELEAEVAFLKQTSGALVVASGLLPCASCVAERIKTTVQMDQIRNLEARLAQIEAENVLLKGIIATPPGTVSPLVPGSGGTANGSTLFGDFSMDMELDALFASLIPPDEMNRSSEELFGPLEIESARIALSAVDSLKDKKEAVDTMFETYLAQSRVSNPKEARKLIFKSVRAIVQLLDECSILDRSKVAEIFSVFQARNALHERHFSKLSAPLPSSKPKQPLDLSKLPAEMMIVRDMMHKIPSFACKEARDLIDEMCILSTKRPFDDDLLFQSKHVLYKLEALCTTVDERANMWIAVEVAREGLRKDLTDLMERMEKIEISE